MVACSKFNAALDLQCQPVYEVVEATSLHMNSECLMGSINRLTTLTNIVIY